jgi:pyridoxine 4-dehydrogenase
MRWVREALSCAAPDAASCLKADTKVKRVELPEKGATMADPATLTIGGDLTVRRLGFGAMRVTGRGIWGDPPDHDEAIAVLRRAVESGVNFIDTADSYGPFVSENLIAEALHPYPDDLVIATKGGLVRPGPGRWPADGRPAHLREACEGSLQRLQLEQIPLYQLHRPDPEVPFEDSVGALVGLQNEGKIRHIGLSNVTEAQLDRAQRLTPVVSVQNRYNAVDRRSEAMLDRCENESIAFLPWAPIEGGDIPRDALAARIAKAHDTTAHQVALAWLLARSPVMLPIPGTGSVAHLEENMQAVSLRLTREEVAELNAA